MRMCYMNCIGDGLPLKLLDTHSCRLGLCEPDHDGALALAIEALLGEFYRSLQETGQGSVISIYIRRLSPPTGLGVYDKT